MNRQFFIYLTVAAIAIAAVFTSCKKDDNVKVKLLETVTSPYGDYDKFEYDSQYRLTKCLRYNRNGELLETRTHAYSGNDLVRITLNSALSYEYTKSGNKITTYGPQTWDLNSDGQLVKYVAEIAGNSQVIEYLYQNGNIVKYSYAYTYEAGGTFESIEEYKYDDKKAPMHNCTTPQWYLIYSFKDISTTNNITEWKANVDADTGVHTSTATYVYEYDRDGYPMKRTATYDNGSKEVTEFAYVEL